MSSWKNCLLNKKRRDKDFVYRFVENRLFYFFFIHSIDITIIYIIIIISSTLLKRKNWCWVLNRRYSGFTVVQHVHWLISYYHFQCALYLKMMKCIILWHLSKKKRKIDTQDPGIMVGFSCHGYKMWMTNGKKLR